jgi:hypothetical protein
MLLHSVPPAGDISNERLKNKEEEKAGGKGGRKRR